MDRCGGEIGIALESNKLAVAERIYELPIGAAGRLRKELDTMPWQPVKEEGER